MRGLILSVAAVFAFLTISGDSWGQVYQWVDEKGTLHFSDNPASVPPKKQGKQPRQPEKEKKQVENQPKQAAKEDTLAILKGMEYGNRKIPPRGDSSGGQGAASSGGVRRS